MAPSLLSFARAAAALHPAASGLGLDGTSARRDRFQDRLDRGVALLPNPRAMFENLTGQGVLWLNRTPTISTQITDSGWQAIEAHGRWHRALWRPITRAILSAVVEEAKERAIVFGLFGYRAKQLRRQIEKLGRTPNLRFATAGHPAVPHLFFRCGNPLARINAELSSQGRDPIDWCGPGAIPKAPGGAKPAHGPARSLGRGRTSASAAGPHAPSPSWIAPSASTARPWGDLPSARRSYRLTLKDALAAHDRALQCGGGAPGIVDLGSIASGLARELAGWIAKRLGHA